MTETPVSVFVGGPLDGVERVLQAQVQPPNIVFVSPDRPDQPVEYIRDSKPLPDGRWAYVAKSEAST